MLTYTNKILAIEKIDTPNLPGTILRVHWMRTGTDENNQSAGFEGVSKFDTNSLDPANFVAFEDLTEELILQWIQSDLEDASIEPVILSRIAAQAITVVREPEFPWVVKAAVMAAAAAEAAMLPAQTVQTDSPPA